MWLNHCQILEKRLPPDSIMQYIIQYCRSLKLSNTVDSFENESGLTWKRQNYLSLKSYLQRREFEEAIRLVDKLPNHQAKLLEKINKPRSRTKHRYQDLRYVLYKYLLLVRTEENNLGEAKSILNENIRELVQTINADSSQSSDRYVKDYTYLHEFSNAYFNGSQSISPDNPYTNWNWNKEIDTFWVSVEQAYQSRFSRSIPELRKDHLMCSINDSNNSVNSQLKSSDPEIPLFAYFVAEYMYEGKMPDFMNAGIHDLFEGYTKWKIIEEIIRDPNVKALERVSGGILRGVISATNRLKDKSESNSVVMTVSRSESTKSDTQPDLVGGLVSAEIEPRKTKHPKNSQVEFSGITSPFRQAEVPAIADTRAIYDTTNEVFKESIRMRHTGSTASLLGNIRAMDVCITTQSDIIAAVSTTTHVTHDKRIMIWNLSDFTSLKHLDNNTSKPVTHLLFHPTIEHYLISADMEFDIKLWNWKSGELIRGWKKWHSRIVNKIGVIPGSEERLVSCSSDNTIKVWNLSDTNVRTCTSLHANEPFVSFTFSGEGQNQFLIGALAYSLRIYKVRTLSHLYNVSLTHFKINKIPISHIHEHKNESSNTGRCILVCADNQIKLYEIDKNEIIRNYNARELVNGQKLDANFSPCHNFICSGSIDVRSFDYKRRLSISNPIETVEMKKRDGVFIWRCENGRVEKVVVERDCEEDDEDDCINDEENHRNGINDQKNGKTVKVGLVKWLRYSSDPIKDVLITASIDKKIRVYDIEYNV
ncbi:WD40-repeat-containing domain protein [Paraphysoderma sedebokerense]|nr:WD40-repeat-containing domain protein [Paraphysoderma sedebokerense]